MTAQCQKPRIPLCSCNINFRRGGFFWKKLSTPTLHTSRTHWKPACQLLPKAYHLQEGTHGKPTSASRIRRKKIDLPYCCCREKHFCEYMKASHKRFCVGKYLKCDLKQKWNWGREFFTKLFCCLFVGYCHINHNFEINSIV